MAADATDPTPPAPGGRRYYPPNVPPAAGVLGMWIFLAALFMLFAAAMAGYLLIRVGNPGGRPESHIQLPRALWLSTALVILVSLTLSRALRVLRRERPRAFLGLLRLAMVFAVGFLAVQTPAMVALLREHQRLRQAGFFLYGFIFMLILLHALHVAGGVIALIRVFIQGHRGVYDHEHYLPVRHTVLYWHFLDLVWITMFLTFQFTS